MTPVIDRSNTVLVVDDEPQILLSVEIMLKASGVSRVIALSDSRAVMNTLEDENVDAVVLDLSMPFLSGNELLSEICSHYPSVPVIVMTALNEVEIAVECMRAGAFDYLVKPVEKDRFIATVNRALEVNGLRREVASLKDTLLSGEIEHEDAFSQIITVNRKMRSLFQYCEVISTTGGPVLITGETGVGKELFARSIHTLSGLQGELIPVNVAGLDDTMFSDTLFGHKKGAFSGADQARDGLIEKASGGTLFLDEIGDLTESSQVKLLRLLQDKDYYALGSDVKKCSNARVIVATNRDLRVMMQQGAFRKDLFYRLRSHHVHIPPLRDRLEDVPLLMSYFLEKASEEMGKKCPAVPPELVTLLSAYHFPGNVRELQSMVYDAVTRCSSDVMPLAVFKEAIGEELSSGNADIAVPEGQHNVICTLDGRHPTLKEAEDFLVEEALRRSGGNQGIAATYLGITRQALNKRLLRKRS